GLPERHLGLVTAAEGVLDGERLDRMAETVERHVDLDRLLALAAPLALTRSPVLVERPRATIAVARDLAFQFYYAEHLDLLRAAGRSSWSGARSPTASPRAATAPICAAAMRRSPARG